MPASAEVGESISCMLQHLSGNGRLLHDGPPGRQIALYYGKRSNGVHGIVNGSDDRLIFDFGIDALH